MGASARSAGLAIDGAGGHRPQPPGQSKRGASANDHKERDLARRIVDLGTSGVSEVSLRPRGSTRVGREAIALW